MRYIHSEETLEVPENGTCANSSPVCNRETSRRDPQSRSTTARLRTSQADRGGYEWEWAVLCEDAKSWKRWEDGENGAQLLTYCRSTVKVSIKSRLVTVEGPRGKLTKDLSHIAVNFSVLKKNVIGLEIHHGNRKNVAALRTVRTIINNLIIGVTKGFKYKMRYVYAHFPINVNIEKNAETGNWEVEIRYVQMRRRGSIVWLEALGTPGLSSTAAFGGYKGLGERRLADDGGLLQELHRREDRPESRHGARR